MSKRLLLTFLLATATAHAQVRLSAGPQIGYTLATTTYHLFAVADYSTDYRSGFSGGVTAELGLGHLLLRPAVLYTQKARLLGPYRPALSAKPVAVFLRALSPIRSLVAARSARGASRRYLLLNAIKA